MSLCYILKASLALRLVSVSIHTVVMGLLLRLISRKNIDIGSDFKKIKRCLDHDDVDFKSLGKTKILGTCKYVIFLPYFKLLSKSDAHSFI